jgi:hypothetical protein
LGAVEESVIDRALLVALEGLAGYFEAKTRNYAAYIN